MPCYQSPNLPSGFTTTGRTGYRTEAECVNACREGACCEGTSCSVKPQCQCQGAGKVFKGVGTVCTPNPCCSRCGECVSPNCMPTYIVISYTASFPTYISGFFLNPGRSFSGGVTLTLTAQGEQAQCGQYTVLLTGEAAAALDASRVSIIFRPKERVIALQFSRKAEGVATGQNPCTSQPVSVISSTSTGAINYGEDGYVSWEGLAVFGDGYDSSNGFCFSSGATTDFSTNRLVCEPAGSISVTIQDAY